jgi:hypothetical protein
VRKKLGGDALININQLYNITYLNGSNLFIKNILKHSPRNDVHVCLIYNYTSNLSRVIRFDLSILVRTISNVILQCPESRTELFCISLS